MQQSFTARVYHLIEHLPAGKITTYGRIAEHLGQPGASRAVGNALRYYPFADGGNCYRVIRSDGHVGGYCGQTAGENYIRKVRKLKALGCVINEKGKVVNLKENVW